MTINTPPAFRFSQGKLLTLFLILLLLSVATASGQVQKETYNFNIKLLGLHFGYFNVAVNSNGHRYIARSLMRSNDFMQLFMKLRMETKVEGNIKGKLIVPKDYKLDAIVGSMAYSTSLEFESGRVVKYLRNSQEAKEIVDSDEKIHGIDFLSWFYAIARDTRASDLCNLRFNLKDGKRVALITIGKPVRQKSGRIFCDSTFKMSKGYTAEQMNNDAVVNFRLTYRPSAGANGMYELERIRCQTSRGPIVATRHD